MSVTLQFSTLNEFLERISDQQRHHPAIILHFDVVANDLRIWFWCVELPSTRVPRAGQANAHRPIGTDGLLITPAALWLYRENHVFKTPCCLCAFTDASVNHYAESAIYMATLPPFSGQYVFGCASGRCGYLSESFGTNLKVEYY